MATIRSSLPHEERTAQEPRENRLEPVILSHIREVNDNVRLLRLNAVDPNHTIKVSFLRSLIAVYLRNFPTTQILINTSKVSARPMARYLHPESSSSGRLYYHVYA